MAELIDRRNIYYMFQHFDDGKWTDGVTLRSIIDRMPTVDAVPVVHGRWERSEYHGFLCCSECKDVYIVDEWLEDGKWKYCTNCGAKMDGDGNG